jgi:NADH:ubiquinone oxidoreductase subunit 3 (subunit A)
MSDIIVIFLIQNVLIFLLIFWLLTWLTEYFFKKKQHLTKRQFYECGFRTLSELNIQINVNFSLLCIFLILYDIEFTFLFPFLFNILNIGLVEFFFFFFFLILIFFSLYYDWQFNALGWQY